MNLFQLTNEQTQRLPCTQKHSSNKYSVDISSAGLNVCPSVRAYRKVFPT